MAKTKPPTAEPAELTDATRPYVYARRFYSWLKERDPLVAAAKARVGPQKLVEFCLQRGRHGAAEHKRITLDEGPQAADRQVKSIVIPEEHDVDPPTDEQRELLDAELAAFEASPEGKSFLGL